MAAELKAIDAEPLGTTILKRLGEVLEKAKAGELSSVAICMVYRSGGIGYCASDAPSLSLLIGAAARMQAALIREADVD